MTRARPLRGRRREIGLVADALARTSGGVPSTIALVGEPGIGKSRLAIEAASLANARGFATRWGRAWEAGGAPAYWPWRQVCDDLDRSGPTGQLWGMRAGGAADVEQARFELFDGIARALAATCNAQPTLCIFDDLHAADVPTLQLLAFATRHMRQSRIVWLLTWRDAEATRMPVREELTRISREATIVPLAALTDVDANELIDDVCHDADIELRDKLFRTTGGNPLFLLETLTALQTGHVLPTELEQLPLATGIASIVRDRLAPLSPEVQRLALAASVVGRDVALDLWTAAADDISDSVRRGAQVLVEAGIISVLGRDRWRFGHDLVREAIYRGGGDEVITLHRRVANALDVAVARGDAALAGERAHHGLVAYADSRLAIDWVVEAAEHARAQCAYEEALAILDRAASRLGATAQQDAALNLARARALLDRGDVERAGESFATTIALARKAGDARMVACAVLALGSRYVFGDTLHELIAQIDDAMAALPSSERDLHARLLARKAAALTPAADAEPVLDIARDAYAMIASSTDQAARLEVAVAVGAAFTDFAHPRERIPVNETVVALARARGDRALELRGLTRLVADHMQLGDFGRASTVLATRDALARSLVQARFQWHEPLFRSMSAMLRGDFATCDAAIAEAEKIASCDPNGVRACAVHRTLFLLHADRVDALVAHEATIVAAVRTMTPILSITVRANIRHRTGNFDEARRELASLDSDLAHGGAINHLATLAEPAADCGSEALQRQLYDKAAPYADVYASWGPFGLSCGPPVAAVLGNLAAALGEHERAREHFASALAMTTVAGAHVGRAWTSYWLGRMLAKVGDSDATRVLDDAAREAKRLGMPSLAERACKAAGASPTSIIVATPPPPAASPGLAWNMREQAGSWLVTHGEHGFLVPNLRGMPLLARLAASPHVEVHSLELVSGAQEHEVDAGDAGELLDEKARAAYRKRAAQLADEIDDAEGRGDVDRAEAARDEQEALLKELSRAVGLGGKVRRSGAATERARVAAHRRLREAIKKIGELDDTLGAHLTKAIRTGTFCVYRP